MSIREVDVAIIGTGTSGMGAYRAAVAHTQSIALIEGKVYGTTCARVGCMPSKLLIAAANAAHGAREAHGFGVEVDGVRIDGPAVMRRVQSERDRFVGFVLESVEGFDPAHRIRAHARFVAPQTLALSDGSEIRAGRIVIASGSTPQLPGPLGQLGEGRVDTNDSVFEWPDLPQSVAVFGTGVIGLELGQALHRLGVRVRVFGRSRRLGGISDPEVLQQAMKIFGSELDLGFGTELKAIDDHGDHFTVRWQQEGREQQADFERLLAATGRTPNLASLGIEASGLALDRRGVPVYDPYTCQCGEAPVFIAGDVTGDKALLHEAADEGRIAGDNAGRWPDVRAHPRRTPLAVVFSEPQIASLGENFASLCGRKAAFAVGQVDFQGQGRSRVMRENAGLLRVYAEHGSGRLLGAEIVGPRAEHLAHLLSWSVQAGLSVQQALDMPFYHPVIEEGLRTALRDCAHALHQGPQAVAGCSEDGPGI